MSLKYKPEDFDTSKYVDGTFVTSQRGVQAFNAIIAQRIFDEWLARQPKVYHCEKMGNWWDETKPKSCEENGHSLKSARLVDIKEIEK